MARLPDELLFFIALFVPESTLDLLCTIYAVARRVPRFQETDDGLLIIEQDTSVLEWLHTYYPALCIWESLDFRQSIMHGALDVMKWACAHLRGFERALEKCLRLDKYAIRYTAQQGHIQMLEWLHTRVSDEFF